MSSYTTPNSFGERGTGDYDAPLPFRYLSHDGLCAVDLAHASGVLSDVVAPIDLKIATRIVISTCVLAKPGEPNTGGLLTGLGQNKALALRVVSYKPEVTCGPEGSGPPWVSCRHIIDKMPANNKRQIFGPKDDARTTIPLPWRYTTVRQRCKLTVDGIEPRSVTTSDWYKVWAAANAVDFMCSQLGKRGAATVIGWKSSPAEKHDPSKYVVMRLHLQTCTSALYIVSLCIAAAVPTARPALEDLDVSTLPDVPGRDFRYVAAYREPTLPKTACIMASVAAMRELAHLNINSYISNAQAWTHQEYPGVSITVWGEGGRRSTVRFAMFMVQAGIRDMMIRNRYQTSIFFGWFRDARIGRIVFTSEPHTNDKPSQISAIPDTEVHRTRISFDLELPSAITTPASNEKLHADVQYLEKAMDSRDSFLMIIWLLMALGAHDDEPLDTFQCSILAITVEVRTVWNAVKRPASHSYFLKSGDMVNMVANLAVILLRENTYREMNLIITDNTVEIARGVVRTRSLLKEIQLPVTANVTIS
ncbi:MAG: hypothetical protein Q9166_001119 [cf. Caloplaca sp. 2 TL-2023]